jgi:EAL domain-containing protein (putative c-di-GMP-specific phosphodiesterase class I)
MTTVTRIAPSSIDRPRRHALIVDDDPMALALSRHALQACGFAMVHEANGGEQALACAAKEPIDLIVCDLAMPDQDGLDLMRRLSAQGYRGDVMIASGHDEPMLAAAARAASGHGFNAIATARKPLTIAQLDALLERTPRRRAAQSTAPSLSADQAADALFHGRLVVHYQPIVHAASNALWGVECLARLRDEDGSLIAPARFVDVIERHGLADALLERLVETTCDDAARWRGAGLDPVITLNLSASNLDDLELPQRLDERFRAAGIQPNHVVLELTEGGVVDAYARRTEVLTRLRLHGFGLALDDFGTGFSSMERLRDIPFTELKIDRGFVACVDKDPTKRKILDHSVTLARALGLRTIAEGVERLAELSVVAAAGCTLAQGYLFSRPLSLVDLVAWEAEARWSSPNTASSASSA